MISFIIPAYNAEKTIERTVQSIKRLSITKEIIVVENGSTDNSISVLESISDIRLLHSKKGVSKARNEGILFANGEWIVFVDADDLVLQELDKIEKLLCDQDIYIASYKKDEDDVKHDFRLNEIITGHEIAEVLQWLLDKPTIRMQAWAKIYRRDFLINNQLLFNEEISYSEDSEFLIRTIVRAKKIQISPTIIYQYKSDSLSAMRGVNPDRINNYLLALTYAADDIKYENAIIKDAFRNYVIAHVNILAVHDVFGYDIKMSWTEKKQKMKELLNESIIKRVIDEMSIKDINNFSKIPPFLFHCGLISLGGFCCYFRSWQNRRRYIKSIRIIH